jgi:hypothetical protein
MKDSPIAELGRVLDDLISLLNSEDGKPWVHELRQSRALLDSNILSAVRSLDAIRGGMGSFTDFGISPYDLAGALNSTRAETSAKFETLQNAVYRLASQIRGDLTALQVWRLTPLKEYIQRVLFLALFAFFPVLLIVYIVQQVMAINR